MNKQELIERIKCLKNIFGNKTKYVEKDMVIKLISELDEPEKVKVSEEEAKFLETFNLNYEGDVATALYHVSRTGWGYELTDRDGTELKHLTREARLPKNRKRLIKAILDGYEVNKEKRYLVKLKAVDQYLVSIKDENFLGFLQSRLRSKFTRKELEQVGFGWVFNCEGIEVEEVE
ncbi:DUF1642 domain-containing protein [Streptococcus timonensis]|uniref:DUF1642 domain-containing protein n=1 Tax=Streptococcus timonensis TaxID=1852387 RepID=UPI00094F2227|nr:DUF1642 domain-containing protein [Streptococcus timonensis]